MSADKPTVEAPRPDADQIVDDIERTREQLGDTVDALAAKLDVKAQLKDTTEHAKATVRQSAGEVAVTARRRWPEVAVVIGTIAAAVLVWRRMS